MKDKKSQKDFIVGDIHGNIELIEKKIKESGFQVSPKNDLVIGSIAEKEPEFKVTDMPSLIKAVRLDMEIRQKSNEAHHAREYEKMYPKKNK